MRHTGWFVSGHRGMEASPGMGFSILAVEAVGVPAGLGQLPTSPGVGFSILAVEAAGVPAGLGQLPTSPQLLTSCWNICTFIVKMPTGLAGAQMVPR